MAFFRIHKYSRSSKLTRQKMVAYGFIFLSFVLFLFNHTYRSEAFLLRSGAVDGLSRFVQILSAPVEYLQKGVAEVKRYFFVFDQNKKLLYENEQLKTWQQIATKLDDENQALRKLANLIDTTNYSFVTAKIMADTSSPYSRSYLLSAGKNQGLITGQAVIYGNALIGRLVEVYENSSRLLLITDLNSHIPVQMQSSGERAVLVGSDFDFLELAFYQDGLNYIWGDYCVTSGDDGYFPKGLVVGRVFANLKKIEPIFDIKSLTYVQVINHNSDELRKLEGIVEH